LGGVKRLNPAEKKAVWSSEFFESKTSARTTSVAKEGGKIGQTPPVTEPGLVAEKGGFFGGGLVWGWPQNWERKKRKWGQGGLNLLEGSEGKSLVQNNREVQPKNGNGEGGQCRKHVKDHAKKKKKNPEEWTDKGGGESRPETVKMAFGRLLAVEKIKGKKCIRGSENRGRGNPPGKNSQPEIGPQPRAVFGL